MYEQCVAQNILLEECVTATDEISKFNPDSLNTIRVVTFSNGKGAEVFGSFIRFGRKGKVIDNAHAGGVFAQINVNTGLIESNGINTDGGEFVSHPDSGIQFKGYRIPQWENIKEFCTKAALKVKGVKVCGWDVCVRQDGRLEFIEGNYGPDFDVMQSPLKRGVKKELNKLFVKLYGKSLLL